MRVGAFLGAERADARSLETAFVVVPEMPCAGLGHRAPYGICLGFRHKHRPLLYAFALGTKNSQRF